MFSLDGKLLASGHYKDVQLWDAVTGQHKATFTGHAYWVNGIAFSPDPHGTLLATGDEAGAVLLWGSVPSPTTNAVVSVSPASVQLPAIGEQLTVAIKIAGGENVSRYQATVGFDPSALRYVSSANGDYLPSGASFARPVLKENRVTLASTVRMSLTSAALAKMGKGDGTLATLTFEVVAVKPSTLALSQVKLVNLAGERSDPLVKNGQVVEP